MTMTQSETLSPRERQVVECLVSGCASSSAIAERLVVSPHTVHWYLGEVRRKTGARTRAEIVAWALLHPEGARSAWGTFLRVVEVLGAA